jgi:signal transduction histidine kinase
LLLKFYPGADIGTVPLDWDHVQGAIVNLLRNARDATPRGGEILVTTNRDNDHVQVHVTDTGSGIAEELQARVLEPYFSTKKTGTGLGLPTVRRVAEEHGGSLRFTSEPGKGTQFTLRLPLRPPEPEGPEPRARA